MMREIKILCTFGILSALVFLIQLLSRINRHMYEELRHFENGTTVAIQPELTGKAVLMTKKDGYFRFNGIQDRGNSEYCFVFKSIEHSFSASAGLKSIAGCYIEKNIVFHGDIFSVMPVVRVITRVQKRLIPWAKA